MEKQVKILASAFFVLVLTLSLASAMVVKSVDANNFQPGSQQDITVNIKNTFSEDVRDVSLNLNIPATGIPFSVISSGDSQDISSGDTENFDFTIKASNSATSGDYSIPYTLTYSNESGIQQPSETGVFTLTVDANPELVYSVSTDTPVVGSKGKITLNLVNQGLGDAKFVSVTLIPDGYTLLSASNVYVGTISSDDSQNENFDVIFNNPNPTLTAQIEYKDFNNQLVTKTINLPITVYSQEQALKLGIISPNNTGIYVIVGLVGIVGWMIIRRVRKKKRLNKAQGR
jgi:hypothetical protein